MVGASAAEPIYVDPEHQGDELGTFDDPFRTIREAAEHGTSLVLKGGDYDETLHLTGDLNITGTEGAVISGTVRISGPGNVLIRNVEIAPDLEGREVLVWAVGEEGEEEVPAIIDAFSDRDLSITEWYTHSGEVRTSPGNKSGDDPIEIDRSVLFGQDVVMLLLGSTGNELSEGMLAALGSYRDLGGALYIEGPSDPGASDDNVLMFLEGMGIGLIEQVVPDRRLQGVDSTPMQGMDLTTGSFEVVHIASANDAPLITSVGGTVIAEIDGFHRSILSGISVTDIEDPLTGHDLMNAILDRLLDIPDIGIRSPLVVLEGVSSGSIILDTDHAVGLSPNIEDVRMISGVFEVHDTITIFVEDHEGFPLNGADIRLLRGSEEVYSTPGFDGNDPATTDGRMDLTVLSRTYLPRWTDMPIFRIDVLHSWSEKRSFYMDGGRTELFQAPDGAPRSVEFTKWKMDGRDIVLNWYPSMENDLSGYQLTASWDGGSETIEEIRATRYRYEDTWDGSGYTFALRVKDNDGLLSEPDEVTLQLPNLRPRAPEVQDLVPYNSSFMVSWTGGNEHDFDRIEIEYNHVREYVQDRDQDHIMIAIATGDTAVISGLVEGVQYHFRIVSYDLHGSFAMTQVQTVKLINPPPEIGFHDEEAPDAGDLVIRGRADDVNGSVVSVQYRIDEGEWTNATGTYSWYLRVDEELAPGEHVLEVKAADTESSTIEKTSFEISEQGVDGGSAVPSPEPLLVLIGTLITGLGLFALTDIGLYLMSTALLPLYARITGKKVLDNYIRGKIHGYIIAHPGDHYSAIMRKLDLKNGIFAYHIKVLERENLIRSMNDGRYKRFYPAGMAIERNDELDQVQLRILNRLSMTPGLSQTELAHALDMRKQVVNVNVKAMEYAGIIRIEKDGRSTRLFLRDVQ